MTDRDAVLAAALAFAAALVAPPVPFAVAVLVVVAAMAIRHPLLLAVGLALVVGGNAERSVGALESPLPERVDAPAQLVSDPAPRRFGLQVVVRVDGRRYLAEIPTERAVEVRTMLTGELVHVAGRPKPLTGAPQGWVRSRHLAGRLSVSSIDPLPGSAPWYRLANGVHRTITAGASSMEPNQRSLYTGLVLGDDRAQSDLMRHRFEASGLTHLLAVSGQNVAFIMAVAAPLFRRIGRRGTVVSGAALLVVFVLVTRAEPSVLRAAVMAGIALVAVTLGRVAPGTRVLSLTVVVLLVADPLLAESVGFRLSVAATGGLLLLARPIGDRLPGPEWLRTPLAVTLAAQLATAPLLLMLTGGIPAVAVVANLLAGPAAGAVMMLGVTVGVVAGLVREPIGGVLQVPAELLVRWVEQVAIHSSRAPFAVLGPSRLALLGCVPLVWWTVRRLLQLVRAPGDAASPSPTRAASPPGAPSPTGATRAVAAVIVVLSLWPHAPPPGEHHLVDGATLWVGACGARVVVLSGVRDPPGLLEALWLTGARRVDLVVGGTSRLDSAAGWLLSEQFEVRRRFTLGSTALPGSDTHAGSEPLGSRRIDVGGLSLAASPEPGAGHVARVERRGLSCSLVR